MLFITIRSKTSEFTSVFEKPPQTSASLPACLGHQATLFQVQSERCLFCRSRKKDSR